MATYATTPGNYGRVVIAGLDSTNNVHRSVAVDTAGNLAASIAVLDPAGNSTSLVANEDGQLQVAVRGPRSAFDEVASFIPRPVFQIDGVYGANANLVFATSGGTGGTGETNGLLTANTGTGLGGFGVQQSRRRLQYRPGQGSRARYTAAFTPGVALSAQVAGIGTAESGIYFGFDGAQFGILHATAGVRAIVTMTVTTGSSTAENVTVQLDGVNFSVAVTNSGNIQRTVWELSQGAYTGWSTSPVGATVVFVKGAAGAVTIGNFSLTATTAVASFAETRAGNGTTDTWAPQSTWNGDKMDGTGGSGVTIDPTKLNVYEISMQYLGAGAIDFQIEAVATNRPPAMYRVHTLTFPNMLTVPSLSNPSFPFTFSAASLGATGTDLTVSSASAAGFIEGNFLHLGNRFARSRTLSSTVDAGADWVFFVLQNTRSYKNKANQGVVYIVNVSAAVKHTQPVIVKLFRSTLVTDKLTLAGNPNFSFFQSQSCILLDESATQFSLDDNSQLLWEEGMGETGNIDHVFTDDEEITVQPGEYIVGAARTTQNTANTVTMTLTWREDI